MPRQKSPTLTDAELLLMKIIWQRGPSTVSDVVTALPEDQPRAYSTVLTTLRILEGKGYLRHKKKGRAYIYEAVVDRGEARRGALQYVLERFFNNSPELLVLNVFKNEAMTAEDMERLIKMIEESESN